MLAIVMHAVLAAFSIATAALAIYVMGDPISMGLPLVLTWVFVGELARDINGYLRARRGKPRTWESE